MDGILLVKTLCLKKNRNTGLNSWNTTVGHVFFLIHFFGKIIVSWFFLRTPNHFFCSWMMVFFIFGHHNFINYDKLENS